MSVTSLARRIADAAAGDRRPSADGRAPAGPARLRRVLTLLVTILLAGQCAAGAAWAGSWDKYKKNSRGSYNSSYYEAFRKEMERKAKEQARAQQQAVRNMEKARAQQQQQKQQQSNNKRTQKEGAADDPSALDDEADGMTDAERNVRVIARERQREIERVQRELQQQARSEQTRAERIHERMARRHERELEKRTKSLQLKQPPAAQPAAVAADGPFGPGDTRREKLFESLQAQASHLGMGRNALKGGRETAKGAENGAAEGGAPVGRLPGAGDDGGVAAPRADALLPRERRNRSFPGKDIGAEMPSKMFLDERKGELIVSDISPVDLETAKAHGFVLGDPIGLKGGASSVRRLVAPRGVGRDEAERELHKILPFLPVMPNHAYTIFMGTLGESEGASALTGLDPRKISPASSKPCPSATCFGGQLIKWNKGLDSCTKSARIGVIDTSFDTDHPAFKSLNAEYGEFLNGERPSPYDWHGTAVLSLLAGNPHSGTPGLVPDATFLLATAFRSDVNGNASTDTLRLLAALDWLDQLDVDIVNMSFSGPQDNALAAAIERMSKKGVIFIAAAGNMGPTAAPSYPAAYENVIAVTAINRDGANYKSANRGSYIDVSAPGVDILTALPDAKQGYRTGTSFAVPFVTAILSAHAGRGERMSEHDLLAKIETEDLGPPGPDPIYGAGLAKAPQKCARGSGAVADNVPSALDAWSTQTTFIRAGAGFAP